MNTALQQQRLEVEQLRREAVMKRIPVSQAVEDIKVKWLPKIFFFIFDLKPYFFYSRLKSKIWEKFPLH